MNRAWTKGVKLTPQMQSQFNQDLANLFGNKAAQQPPQPQQPPSTSPQSPIGQQKQKERSQEFENHFKPLQDHFELKNKQKEKAQKQQHFEEQLLQDFDRSEASWVKDNLLTGDDLTHGLSRLKRLLNDSQEPLPKKKSSRERSIFRSSLESQTSNLQKSQELFQDWGGRFRVLDKDTEQRFEQIINDGEKKEKEQTVRSQSVLLAQLDKYKEEFKALGVEYGASIDRPRLFQKSEEGELDFDEDEDVPDDIKKIREQKLEQRRKESRATFNKLILARERERQENDRNQADWADEEDEESQALENFDPDRTDEFYEEFVEGPYKLNDDGEIMIGDYVVPYQYESLLMEHLRKKDSREDKRKEKSFLAGGGPIVTDSNPYKDLESKLKAKEKRLKQKSLALDRQGYVLQDSRRQLQAGSLIMDALKKIFNSDKLLTEEKFRKERFYVERVEVSRNVATATVYWNCWNPASKTAEPVLKEFQKTLRFMLAQEISQIKYVPYLYWVKIPTEAAPKEEKVKELIKELEKERPNRNDAQSQPQNDDQELQTASSPFSKETQTLRDDEDADQEEEDEDGEDEDIDQEDGEEEQEEEADEDQEEYEDEHVEDVMEDLRKGPSYRRSKFE